MICSESEPENETIIPQNPVVLQQNLLEWQNTLKKLRLQFGLKHEQYAIIINISKQSLYLIKNSKVVKSYPVSTSKYGIGNKEGSNKTPTGTHRIFEKNGKDAKIGTIFMAGKNTKTIAKIYNDNTKIQQD
ncbi:L,D-transpeptidase, partial [candidate division WOR-3 bacterium]|nr:L,D-transpeptidase [candidate division WOR-3 bacterium]